MAFLLKMNCPSLKLIWHDHYGDSEFLSQRASLSLKIILPFFDGIIAVNQKLKVWVEQKMNFKNTVYLPNFLCEEKNVTDNTVLKGTTGKRIVCLANLRVQKDHFLLLEVAKKIKKSHPDWTVHLVGKDFDDDYSKKIKNIIVEFNLEKTVFFYGTKQDVSNILNQSTIGVLTSKSEGLPVALLEYGRHKMPVVVTNVGEISSLVQDSKNGFVVVAQNEELFHKALILLMENDFISMNFGDALYKTVLQNNSEEVVIKQYLSWLQNNKQK
jgi:glycosyltransferase involved in cell wall biosynthesis